MSILFYNIFLFLYSSAIRIAAIFNPKARLWILGRRQFPSINFIDFDKIIWMHCASLGEFEQGRPLLKKIKIEYPNYKIVLSFFSPSGYEVIKDKNIADYVFYLPMDNIIYAKKFIATINPKLVLWVKYEYWFYYLQELKKRNIPVILVSGIFRKSQPFFKWYGGIWKKMLEKFNHLFVQNKESKHLLQSIGFSNNITVSGDTRFDRVIEISTQSLDDKIIWGFCNQQKVIVAGSTWEDDEIILAAYVDSVNHNQKIIVVPHELDAEHISSLKKMFKHAVCYTDVQKNVLLQNGISNYNILIIDTIGLLSRLYQYGYINYIGGGFTNDGIHNILEAAVWAKPIIMGDNYQKYFEAVDLFESGAAESISDQVELKTALDKWFNDNNAYNQAASASKEYVFANAGASEKIMAYIQENRLLTN